MSRLHVVDGTYELFRAFFSKRPDHKAPDGKDRKATVGVAASMLALLEDKAEAVTHLAVAFDNPIRSVRNDWFDGYKTDEGVAPEILGQFDPVEDAMRALGIVVWSMDQYEADDALGTAAVRWQGEVEQVRIMTPDKDLGQVIRGRKVVQVDRLRQKETDEDGLIARRGILPESIPDWLALVGDDADGIPGVPGFGEKTAAALLKHYVHLEKIPERAADWKVNVRGADKLAASLGEMREQVLLYRKLATLITDVPLKETLADLEWKGAPREAFLAWCDRLGVNDLRDRPRRWR